MPADLYAEARRPRALHRPKTRPLLAGEDLIRGCADDDTDTGTDTAAAVPSSDFLPRPAGELVFIETDDCDQRLATPGYEPAEQGPF